MGRSPGKWIKTVLFRKKNSKSQPSKGATVEKKATPELPLGDLSLNHSAVGDTPSQKTDACNDKAESDKSILGSVPSETDVLLVAEEPIEFPDKIALSSVNNEETRRLEQAAIKAQAAFRGYLARRAFWALKGIIRLQALIRGHLVRRQAASTLRCMHSIVRLQALARGRRVRSAYPGLKSSIVGGQNEFQVTAVVLPGMSTASWSGKLATNVFASKLLASLPKAMALSLHYGPDEPNSAWNWLERWSLLRFWKKLAYLKTVVHSKSEGKHAATKITEGEAGKSKRTVRKVGTKATGENASSSLLEVDKPRRYLRKSASHHSESPIEQPQNELERVKRSLRKVSASSMTACDKSETEIEKPLQTLTKSTVAAHDVSEPTTVSLFGKTSESTTVVDKLAETEMFPEQLKVEDPVDMLDMSSDNPTVEQNPLGNFEKSEIGVPVNEDLNAKGDQNGIENQRSRRRRSLPAKEEYPENTSQNTPTLPNYMAATESAKAKLRMQGSIKFSEDGVDNALLRRHSLPTAINGKSNSLSPRIQKLAQVNGKGSAKSNTLLSSSRDERVLQPGWRR